jgi:heat shock protein HslJ
MAAAGFRAAALALACTACTSIAVDARTFEGTRWRVTGIDGRATPASGEYRLEFRKGQISGRFGCNGWGGTYAVAGGTLRASDVRSTLMGCPQPAASFEREGMAILQQPMHWIWTKTRLTLSNSIGSIRLERAH